MTFTVDTHHHILLAGNALKLLPRLAMLHASRVRAGFGPLVSIEPPLETFG